MDTRRITIRCHGESDTDTLVMLLRAYNATFSVQDEQARFLFWKFRTAKVFTVTATPRLERAIDDWQDAQIPQTGW